ncbi:Cgl0159 family (beta/alpha)8-fold protein [Streptomyces xiaopingdaonensis]|uniref:Cgl0159 family (beta/alpha)8-fold protein n=1 Tax=Streptomyces xiaopingdaonensis TaxID=1565415 RepID=UPI000527C5DB|nr:hypothetical protein [Streptomyces xiaopingdaonensis]
MLSPRVHEIVETRATAPGAISEAAARRVRAASPLGEHGKALIIAADHPARGSHRVGNDPWAMANRFELLDRLCRALERPGVTGVLATADILEDLLLLGVLDDKSVFGSMNRAGLAQSAFEVDDRFTGYDPAGIAERNFDGGKMLLRIALEDSATPSALENCARAVDGLNERGLIAMIEPFLSRWKGGRLHNDLSTDAVVTSVTVASGLGRSTAYSWLKVPVVPDMERVLAASTLPVLLLGGDVADAEAAFASWKQALEQPTARGLVVGRSLLFPSDGDVAGAVDRAVSLL